QEPLRPGRTPRTPPDLVSPGERDGGANRALVPESGRRREDPRDLPGLARRRRPRHPDPAGGRQDPLRIPGRPPRRRTLSPWGRATGCHAYTHVDAPLHFLVDGRDIAAMPVDQWVGDAAVVDLTHLGANGEVTAADLDRRAGHVRAGDIVLLRTDWPKRTSIADEAFWEQGPWTGPSACKWLVDRKVKAVGYDSHAD